MEDIVQNRWYGHTSSRRVKKHFAEMKQVLFRTKTSCSNNDNSSENTLDPHDLKSSECVLQLMNHSYKGKNKMLYAYLVFCMYSACILGAFEMAAHVIYRFCMLQLMAIILQLQAKSTTN